MFYSSPKTPPKRAVFQRFANGFLRVKNTEKSEGTEPATISTELLYSTIILLQLADHKLFFKGSLEKNDKVWLVLLLALNDMLKRLQDILKLHNSNVFMAINYMIFEQPFIIDLHKNA